MVTTPELASEPDVYRGPEGVRRWWESFLDVMEWVRWRSRAVDPVDDDRVILEFVIRTRGSASGIETDQHAVGLATAARREAPAAGVLHRPRAARAAAGLPPS